MCPRAVQFVYMKALLLTPSLSFHPLSHHRVLPPHGSFLLSFFLTSLHHLASLFLPLLFTPALICHWAAAVVHCRPVKWHTHTHTLTHAGGRRRNAFQIDRLFFFLCVSACVHTCAHMCACVCGCFVLGVCLTLNDFLFELVVRLQSQTIFPLSLPPSLRLLLLRPLQPGHNSI